jgi:hypothetical protein
VCEIKNLYNFVISTRIAVLTAMQRENVPTLKSTYTETKKQTTLQRISLFLSDLH